MQIRRLERQNCSGTSCLSAVTGAGSVGALRQTKHFKLFPSAIRYGLTMGVQNEKHYLEDALYRILE
jgi:hypothetical protein